jgi:acyl-CoA reductase-like NAD-dependent aldehyde dehydrogenase
VIAYDSEDEAIRIANDSKYGLHAAVIGTDLCAHAGSPLSCAPAAL